MGYSEVGEITPNIAKDEWNAQFSELYDLVESAESEGATYIKRLESDVVNSTNTYAEVGLQFPVVSGGFYMFRAHIIWAGEEGLIDTRLDLNFSGPTNDGSSFATLYQYRDGGFWYDGRVNDAAGHGFPPASTFTGPIPSVYPVNGLFRATANGVVKAIFRRHIAGDAVLTIKAGSTLEVHRV